MTEKRKYIRQCKGKHRHASFGKAEAHRRGLPPDERLNSYFCCYCKSWHVGHRPMTQWEKAK